MRFHVGPVPEGAEFVPEEQGWSAIREPGAWLLQLYAVPVAIVAGAVTAGLLTLVMPPELPIAESSALSLPSWLVITILILLIPVHEALHAVFHPGAALTPKTVIGLWPSRLLFYAHYEGAMPRDRLLLVFVGPYFLLSVLPIPVIALLRVLGVGPVPLLMLAFLSFIGAIVAAGDVVGFLLVLTQVPAAARVRNKGWRTYWRPEPHA